MVLEYRHQKDDIINDLRGIQRTFEGSLGLNLWKMNQTSLQSTIEGMLEIPVIVGVKIKNINDLNVAVGGMVAKKDKAIHTLLHVDLLGFNDKEITFQTSKTYDSEIFMHQFPIVYNYKKEIRNMGVATIYSSRTVIFNRVKLGFALLIFNAGVKTAALWVIFLWISNRLLRKPLTSLASDTKKVTLKNLDSYRIRIDSPGQNELKVIEESFNSMINNLDQSIKEQIKTKTELEESEKRFRDSFNNATIGMCLTSVEGELLMANAAMGKILGYSQTELQGEKFGKFTHPDDIKLSFDKISNLIKGKQEATRFEKRYIHKSGKVIWTKIGTFLSKDANGTPQYFITHLEDITKQRKADVELKQFAQRLSLHVEQTPLGVIEWDLDFRVTQWNSSAQKIFGYSKEEAIGQGGMQLIIPSEVQNLVQPIWKDLVSGTGGTHFKDKNITKEGKLIICDWYNTSLLDNNGVTIGVASLVQNITEQTQFEKEKETLEKQLRQSQKMEAMGTLAGGVAHDFNNILGIILGYADILNTDLALDKHSVEKLKEIIKAGNRAKDLVTQILAFSRQNKKEFIPIHPDLVIKEALKMLRSSIPTTIKIESSIPKLGFIIGDPTQLHQIMMNLCTNAYHAMRETGGVLKVVLEPIRFDKNDTKILSLALSPGEYMKLEISDTGHGMNKETQQKIFDPYYTTKKKGEGTGLGLSVVHGIVKSFGGLISIYSEPGKGTSFMVYFPRVSHKKDALVSSSIKALPTGNEHILIVDDEEPIVNMEKLMLDGLGYKVSAFTNSLAAFKFFQDSPENFSLVVTDVTMPELSGVELLQKIRNIRPSIPLILCSGFSDLMNEEKAKHIDHLQYLKKPILKRDLAVAIRQLIDHKTPD